MYFHTVFFFLSSFPDFSARHRHRGRSSRFQTDEVANWVQELKYAAVRSWARHDPWKFSAGYCSTVNNEPSVVWCLHLNTAVRSPTLTRCFWTILPISFCTGLHSQPFCLVKVPSFWRRSCQQESGWYLLYANNSFVCAQLRVDCWCSSVSCFILQDEENGNRGGKP